MITIRDFRQNVFDYLPLLNSLTKENIERYRQITNHLGQYDETTNLDIPINDACLYSSIETIALINIEDYKGYRNSYSTLYPNNILKHRVQSYLLKHVKKVSNE